ncbi:hypothetical protein DQ238_16215 [Geodermatophilus sp. TF02-6]|uniref:hypothetical protein n=1 Tax=Geodermatophilus sp. TF02-6 TaxID=2250575 RepID=UPI000DEBB3FE|nr:hypothetical protein [Geodermatophilus sp. TF02-6]RBY76808.1 hypothetical protein DQ238_16215 [Geodermatophilus sp. TF02-6]
MHVVVRPQPVGNLDAEVVLVGPGVLARGVLDATRAAGDSVLPVRPFIRQYVQRHPDCVDLVPADRRAEFELRSSAGGPGEETAETDPDAEQVPDKQVHRWKDDGGAVVFDG